MSILTDKNPIDDKTIWNTYPDKTPLKKHFFIGTCDFSGDTDLYYLNNDGQCIKPNEENGIVYYIPKFWAYPPKGHGWHNEDAEQTRAAPHPDAPIEEIDAYLTEKNRELYERLADGDSEQDAPITPEFLEGLGFEFNDDESVRISSGEGWKVVVHFGEKVTVFAGTKGALLAELPHIRTQSQLTNLIAALFGGGE